MDSAASAQIGLSTADFVRRQAMLVAESDGSRHAVRADGDTRRTVYLPSQGYRVLRFWNNDMLTDISSVLAVVWEVLASAVSHASPGRVGTGSLPGRRGSA